MSRCRLISRMSINCSIALSPPFRLRAFGLLSLEPADEDMDDESHEDDRLASARTAKATEAEDGIDHSDYSGTDYWNLNLTILSLSQTNNVRVYWRLTGTAVRPWIFEKTRSWPLSQKCLKLVLVGFLVIVVRVGCVVVRVVRVSLRMHVQMWWYTIRVVY